MAQQLRIHSGQPRQRLRIQPIILAAALADQLHLPGVGHDHLVPQALQQTAYPRRVRAHFHGHPAAPQRAKFLGQRFFRRAHAAFLNNLALFSQHAITAGFVSQVHTDRDRPCFYERLPVSDSVGRCYSSSWPVSFALRVRTHWELNASRRGPAFSFHLGGDAVQV